MTFVSPVSGLLPFVFGLEAVDLLWLVLVPDDFVSVGFVSAGFSVSFAMIVASFVISFVAASSL